MAIKGKSWSISTWVRQSNIEYGKYKRTGEASYLAQAGEKLWNAFSLLMDKVASKELYSYSQVKKEVIAKDDDILYDTFRKVYDLHEFFYRGFTESMEEKEDEYLLARGQFKLLRQRYGG